VIIHTAHKIQLEPNNIQATFFEQCAGTSRFVWNHALCEWDLWYKNGMKPNGRELKKAFNSYRKKLFPWTSETHRDAYSQPFENLNQAFSRFFKGSAKYPKFKKKGVKDSFYVSNDKLKIKEDCVRLPKIGWIRLTESLRFKGRVLSAVVSKTAGKWFIAINVEIDIPTTERKPISVVGIDLGLNVFAALSTGETFTAPKPYKHLAKRVRLLSKSMSRKVKGSNNWRKSVTQLSKLHARIANIRKDFIHKLTTKLVKEHSKICIEDLYVKGMVRNRNLAKSILDASWSELRRQLEYKCKLSDVELVVADRWFPSTKLCMRCGQTHKMPLHKRTFKCDCNGLAIDRDIHAAQNLRDYAVGLTVSA